MAQVAEQTFLASMRLAGIEAAKECSKSRFQWKAVEAQTAALKAVNAVHESDRDSTVQVEE